MSNENDATSVAQEQTHSIGIDVPPETGYRAICNFTSYPKWIKRMKSVAVRSTFPDGRPQNVEFTIDAIFRNFRYVLDYIYDDENFALKWTYVEGDIKDCYGSYIFEPLGKDKCHVTFHTFIDSGIPIPKRIVTLMGKVEMRKSMKDLKGYLESLG